MKIILNDKTYNFLIGYQDQEIYRSAFNNLSKKIFGLSFEEWYQSGYWREKYIPYTLFEDDKAIANVSVNLMDFEVFGLQEKFIQIGTVMTDENYRNQNLGRFLLEKILDEWSKCDLIYLFANSTVLNMYPKFGFKRVTEYEYFKPSIQQTTLIFAEKLDMDLQSNRSKLHDYVKNSFSFGKISLKENADLVLFYCITSLKNNVFYIKELDAVAIVTYHENQLRLWDVFSKSKIELQRVIETLINTEINEIVLGFTPLDCESFNVREITNDDHLFVQSNKTKLFVENKLMFPLLSHA